MLGFHHVEIWLADLESVAESWAWLLTQAGFVLADDWGSGQSWQAGGAYLTLTTSPNASATEHDRRRPGMNHIALKTASTDAVDAIMAQASAHGWTPLYHERYPHAGGPQHYAGWLENAQGFKVELVAE